MALKVLHVGKFFPPFSGGIENFLSDLLYATQKTGLGVAALVHAHHPPWHRRPRSTTQLRPPFPLYRVPTYGRVLYAPVSPSFPFWLNRIIRALQPDLLHLHMPNTSALWVLALPAARRLPWVVHWHADVVASTLDRRLSVAYPIYRPLEQRLLARAARIIVTSPPYLGSSQPLAQWRNKCQVIPLGLDPQALPLPTVQALATARAQWGERACLRVLAVGRLTYYKGYEVLLRALAQMPEAKLLIVGEGERETHLRNSVASLSIGNRARLLGARPAAERNALLASCDVFCLPSLERTEAFGVVLLEAMRYARSVVASAISGSGVGWVVQDGDTGLLFPPGDDSALAGCLRQLHEHPEARNLMGQAGYQRFTQVFHIERVAAETSALYHTLFSRW